MDPEPAERYNRQRAQLRAERDRGERRRRVREQENTSIKHGKTHSELVDHYMMYWHYWNTQIEEAQLRYNLIDPTDFYARKVCDERRKWAIHHSTNADRLADYHMVLSEGEPEPFERPASPLPPPPYSFDRLTLLPTPCGMLSANNCRNDSLHPWTCEASDPEECVLRTREIAAKRFKSSANNDQFSARDIAIKTIWALLATNAEIFDRCKANISVNTNAYDERYIAFEKNSFNVVKVQNLFGLTQIGVFQGKTEKSFNLDLLLNLPKGLDIFQPTREASGFIDFKTFLRTSLMLHDDILLPFLTKLKEHLEQVQVCLGEVDAWLMDATNNIAFLETTFQVTLLPGEAVCRCGNHLQLLAEYNIEGKFEATFDISQEGDRAHLERLLGFINAMYSDIMSVLQSGQSEQIVERISYQPLGQNLDRENRGSNQVAMHA